MPDTAIYIKAKSGAALGEMSIRKFRYLVSDGKLPGPVRIEGLVRWRRDELVAALERLADAGGALKEN